MRLLSSVIVLITVIVMIFSACDSRKGDASEGSASPQNAMVESKPLAVNPDTYPGSDIIQGKGRIIYLGFEGGFYGLASDDGRNFLPTNLPASFRQSGLNVEFSARPGEEQNTIYMWGVPVEIIEIKELNYQER